MLDYQPRQRTAHLSRAPHLARSLTCLRGVTRTSQAHLVELDGRFKISVVQYLIIYLSPILSS
jgi:hypothetical protein